MKYNIVSGWWMVDHPFKSLEKKHIKQHHMMIIYMFLYKE